MLFGLLNTLFTALYTASEKANLQKWADMFYATPQPLSEIVVMDSNNTAWVYPLVQNAAESIKDN